MIQRSNAQIWLGDKVDSGIGLKVHKIEIFLASILKFVIFLCQLCQNIKILGKFFFDWTIMGGATIIPRSPFRFEIPEDLT
jgi:hypothetical protein